MFVSPKMCASTEVKSSFEYAYNEILELKGKWTEWNTDKYVWHLFVKV